MGSSLDDEEQLEWCRQWAAEHERKRTRRKARLRTTLAWLLAAVVDKEGKDDDEGGRG